MPEIVTEERRFGDESGGAVPINNPDECGGSGAHLGTSARKTPVVAATASRDAAPGFRSATRALRPLSGQPSVATGPVVKFGQALLRNNIRKFVDKIYKRTS
jgi:hypothetical protein